MNRFTWLILILLVIGGSNYWSHSSGLTKGIEQGRKLENAEWVVKENKRIAAEKNAVIEADKKNKLAEQKKNEALANERKSHEERISKLEDKYDRLLADSRARRGVGLRIDKASICGTTAAGVEAPSPSGVVQEASARLPREVEQGLYEFARDRDKIILDFEEFKQEVRISGCFAQQSAYPQ